MSLLHAGGAETMTFGGRPHEVQPAEPAVSEKPSGGLCTLAKCKYGKKRRNIVEIAEVGDWIIGTGGANPKRSAGHGKLVYAMRVDEKITLAEYFRRYEGKRLDADDDCPKRGRYALLSRHFCYFGQNAMDIPDDFIAFEKDGQNFKSNF